MKGGFRKLGFQTSTKKACTNATRGKAPLRLVDMRPLIDTPALGAETLRGAIARGELTHSKGGLGSFLKHAVALRTAAVSPSCQAGCAPLARSLPSRAVAVRRASEVAQLVTNDVDRDTDRWVAIMRAANQKNVQVGEGQLAFPVAIPARGDACPMHGSAAVAWADRLRLRGRLERPKDQAGRMVGDMASGGGRFPAPMYFLWVWP